MNEPSFENKKEADPSFEKIDVRENVLVYVFNNVTVKIDTTGKNQKELPELTFGIFEGDDYKTSSIDQPEEKIGVAMEYVMNCIHTVVKDSGIHIFWVYPHGEDQPEDKKRREQVRFRLFRKYADLKPAKDDFGYILEI